MKRQRSAEINERLRRLIPGGVNSPARSFNGVGGDPPVIADGRGSRVSDADGNEYVDYLAAWGPLILGHAAPVVVTALDEVARRGTAFGAPTELEYEMARLVVDAVPSVEMVRFVNSGTEATMSALRLARGYTHRDIVVKFEGCYHGHVDSLLVQAGSGVATLGLKGVEGVPDAYTSQTIVVPFNNLAAASEVFAKSGDRIACVIVEPVAANMGVVPPAPGFLEGLRGLTTRHGALLVFDEVVTGFRLGRGGAQEKYGITPDLTCLGKVIGGGLPVAAYGGRAELMETMAPVGPVYQAGTLSGNPLAMAAGIATLSELAKPGTYDRLESRARRLEEGLLRAAQEAEVELTVQRVGSMLTPFFTGQAVADYAGARRADGERFKRFFWSLLDQGHYLAPSAFESSFVSLAHSEADVDSTVEAAHGAMSAARRG
ncbi:MAG: glutamate-1-semialdehyde 2,1-aminomutase [Dehalococcoidia bacterium]|nr:glutamate-1-semialdehyde 2,1-aminomutase [Dehalococcoidia bacterium]